MRLYVGYSKTSEGVRCNNILTLVVIFKTFAPNFGSIIIIIEVEHIDCISRIGFTHGIILRILQTLVQKSQRKNSEPLKDSKVSNINIS